MPASMEGGRERETNSAASLSIAQHSLLPKIHNTVQLQHSFLETTHTLKTIEFFFITTGTIILCRWCLIETVKKK